MPLRDQPYLPLYVQDFMTDEKLAECSAAATGVYIRIMCLMHKNETYGKILLKQKYKQTDNQIQNFASMVAKNLPYTENTVLLSLQELIEEKVLHIEGDFLVQRRMVKDNEISEKRALAGKSGGKKTQLNTKNFAKAKSEANTEIEYENEIENKSDKKKKAETEKELNDVEVGKTIEYMKFTGQRMMTPDHVKTYWEGFLIHSEGEFHRNRADKLQHFRNWLKKQPAENGKTTKRTTDTAAPGSELSAI